MPKPGEIKYCDPLGGLEANAAFVWIPPGSFWMGLNYEYDLYAWIHTSDVGHFDFVPTVVAALKEATV